MASITISHEQIEYAASKAQDEVEVREDYSGRGMHGETCFGIVPTNDTEAIVFMVNLATRYASDVGWEDFLDALRGMLQDHSTDNMGRGVVHYYPNVKVGS